MGLKFKINITYGERGKGRERKRDRDGGGGKRDTLVEKMIEQRTYALIRTHDYILR